MWKSHGMKHDADSFPFPTQSTQWTNLRLEPCRRSIFQEVVHPSGRSLNSNGQTQGISTVFAAGSGTEETERKPTG